MTDIPASAREFERWFDEVRDGWPEELEKRGEYALLTLQSLAGNPNAHQSAAFMEASRKDLMAFAEAYGAWKAMNAR